MPYLYQDNAKAGDWSMTLPERCKGCTHYADMVCCHPDPFPHIIAILEGATCESFEQNYDMDEDYIKFCELKELE